MMAEMIRHPLNAIQNAAMPPLDEEVKKAMQYMPKSETHQPSWETQKGKQGRIGEDGSIQFRRDIIWGRFVMHHTQLIIFDNDSPCGVHPEPHVHLLHVVSYREGHEPPHSLEPRLVKGTTTA